eukprot:1182345-Prorocentrum_minimum.AAC.1
MPATPFYALCNTATRNGARRVGETECGRTRRREGLYARTREARRKTKSTLPCLKKGLKKDQTSSLPCLAGGWSVGDKRARRRGPEGGVAGRACVCLVRESCISGRKLTF